MPDTRPPYPRRSHLEPIPVPETTAWVKVLDRALVIVCAGGVFLTLVSGLLLPVRGGRRSARLTWEAREKAARDAVAASHDHAEEDPR